MDTSVLKDMPLCMTGPQDPYKYTESQIIRETLAALIGIIERTQNT